MGGDNDWGIGVYGWRHLQDMYIATFVQNISMARFLMDPIICCLENPITIPP